MNWLYQNYLSRRDAHFIGFIDHDIYPIKPTTLIDKLEHHRVFGEIQIRGKQVVLMVRFLFFEQDFLSGWKPNFLPAGDLDAGGGNWQNYIRD